MSIFGIDYAWSKPSVEAMTAAGVKFIARYLSNDPSKDLTRAEATAANAADIWCVVVWETTANRALAGRQAGRDDALTALHKASALGMPDDRPIYFAVDFDASPADYPAIREYFIGAASPEGGLGKDRVGMYGGINPIKWAFDNKLITWGWQTYAWSGGLWDSRAHIQQYKNGVKLGGADVDYDRAMYDDYGQWKIGESPMALSDADKAWLKAELPKAMWKQDNIIKATDDNTTNPYWAPDFHVYDIGRRLRAVHALLVSGRSDDDVDEAAIVAGVLAGLSPETLAEAIAGHLGTDVAAGVLDALRSRLEA